MSPEEPAAEYEPDERWPERLRDFRDFLDDAFLEYASYVLQEGKDQRLELRVIDAEGMEAFIYLNRVDPAEPEYLGWPTAPDDAEQGLYRFRGLIRLDYSSDVWAWAVAYRADTNDPILIPGSVTSVDEEGTFLFIPQPDTEIINKTLLELIKDAVNEADPVKPTGGA